MNQTIIPVALGQNINAVLRSLPEDGQSVILQLEKGTYTEKIVVDRPYVTLRGKGMHKTRLSFSDASNTELDGKPMGTSASASVTVKAPYFCAEDLTFANDFDYPSMKHLVSENPGKVKGLQAVALWTTGSSDHSVFTDCAFFGYQDTLFLDKGSHFLGNCLIEGNIDFIFGSGTALFEECTILSNGEGYVCAPSTKEDQLGFCFHHCIFSAKPDIADGSVWLGRPWHPGAVPGVCSYAFLYRCELGSHIRSDGWTWMHAFPKNGGDEVFFYPEDSRFLEAANTGHGASSHREQLDENQAISEFGKFRACTIM